MLKELKQRREAQLLILERLIKARNKVGKGSRPLDRAIKDTRKKVAKISLKIFKIKVDNKKQNK